jgi:hypothetical protein
VKVLRSIRRAYEKEKWYFYNYFFNNLCDNFISHTHITFSLSLSISFVFGSIPCFHCKFVVFTKVVMQIVVQITQLYGKNYMWLRVLLDDKRPLKKMMRRYVKNGLSWWVNPIAQNFGWFTPQKRYPKCNRTFLTRSLEITVWRSGGLACVWKSLWHSYKTSHHIKNEVRYATLILYEGIRYHILYSCFFIIHVGLKGTIKLPDEYLRAVV